MNTDILLSTSKVMDETRDGDGRSEGEWGNAGELCRMMERGRRPAGIWVKGSSRSTSRWAFNPLSCAGIHEFGCVLGNQTHDPPFTRSWRASLGNLV